MDKKKMKQEENLAIKTNAQRLLVSPNFFGEFLLTVEKAGLVGERKNALVVLIVVVSRLLRRPLNLFIKGASSSGKNWLAKCVFQLMPRGRIREISSASDKAWNYSRDDFRQRVVYLQERNEAAGVVHPIRLLISEGRLVRLVTRWLNGERVTSKHVARGPVASISTTTKHGLQIDDETRHVSIWVDESPAQTREIVKACTKQGQSLSASELQIWHMVQRLLEERAGAEIVFPGWFDRVAETVFVEDVSVRRYYPAFIEACRVVCLIRSFQRDPQPSKDGTLEVEFADFAIAALILDSVFVQSLHRHGGSALETRQAVESISGNGDGQPVQAKDLARELGIPLHRAYQRLCDADEAGTVRRVNAPVKDNRKFYVPAPRPRFIPDPQKLFGELNGAGDKVRFVNPFTGEWVNYSQPGPRKKKVS